MGLYYRKFFRNCTVLKYAENKLPSVRLYKVVPKPARIMFNQISFLPHVHHYSGGNAVVFAETPTNGHLQEDKWCTNSSFRVISVELENNFECVQMQYLASKHKTFMSGIEPRLHACQTSTLPLTYVPGPSMCFIHAQEMSERLRRIIGYFCYFITSVL